MPDPVAVFIASSQRSRPFGEAAKAALAEVHVRGCHWDDIDSFQRGDTIFNQLYSYSRGALNLDTPDAAICILTSDDETRFHDREEWVATSRHNVIFEAGLFIGAFGRERVLLLVEEGLGLPSDLQGIVFESLPKRTSGQSMENYVRDSFPADRIRQWVAQLPPSIGPDDDLRRIQRRISGSCKTRGIASLLRFHCQSLSKPNPPDPTRVESALRNHSFIRVIEDESRRTIRSHQVVTRDLEVDFLPATAQGNRDARDTLRSWFVALIRKTVLELSEPPTKVAILGKPSLQMVTQAGFEIPINGSNDFASRGVRLLEYVVDTVQFPIVYVDDSRFESGDDPDANPIVMGEVGRGDNVLIVHDVALTGRKLLRCKEALEVREAKVGDVCLIVACRSRLQDGGIFCVREQLATDGLAVQSLLELDVFVHETGSAPA
jgi:hypothetical protein